MNWQPGMKLEDVERETILRALRFYRCNKAQTAAALGISTKTLYNKLIVYGVENGKEVVLQTGERFRMESALEIPKKQPVPVREREEIQSVPPAPLASGDSK